ncbi:MAG TPA: DNA translocase FtsK 4TM domain-containing protein, partial [Rhodocyclaceae bacterium]|nr:DNA translocase FtsK 4TM domain-containing protein [Rhodocyclaceae bacterium]
MSLYVGLILFGYSQADPGWSHAAEVSRVSNPGGRFGAWLADLLYYLFGLSAWWWVIFLGYGLVWGFRRLRHELRADKRSFFIILTGFVVLLLSSSALEALRFHSHGVGVPLAPGGLVGVELGQLVKRYLGFTGGTLLLIALIASGLSLFSGISWLSVIERIGGSLEQAWLGIATAWSKWKDRRAGRELARSREAAVESKRRKSEAAPARPLRIEPPMVSVPRSERIEKERQQTLFVTPGEGELPPLALLDQPSGEVEPPSADALEFTSRLIETKLADFGVEVKVVAAYPGPVVTRYEIEPATGVKGSQVVNLSKDLARALSLVSIRVVETVPGKSCMAFELPNPKRQVVRLSEILGSKAYHAMHSPLTVALGKDIGGQPVVADLAKMPHLLVAGTTGSGKSVGINAMILSLLYKSEPSRVRLIMVDPKMLELSIYE